MLPFADLVTYLLFIISGGYRVVAMVSAETPSENICAASN